ncbi:hypothetical protein X975_24867, partial [Stegodyphus mimosarum]
MDKLNPYHIQHMQAVCDFTYWFAEQTAAVPNFIADDLFVHKAIFTLEVICNVYNGHVWSHRNPRATRPHANNIKIWAGLFGDRMISIYLLPLRLDGETFHNFVMRLFLL